MSTWWEHIGNTLGTSRIQKMVFNDHPFLLALNTPLHRVGTFIMHTTYVCWAKVTVITDNMTKMLLNHAYLRRLIAWLKLGIWRQKLGGARMPTLAIGNDVQDFCQVSSFLFMNLVQLAYNLFMQIITHEEIIIIVLLQTIFEFTCGAITFCNTVLCIFIIYVRRVQVMIVLWELCALVGFVTQVGWNYELISRKQSKKLLWRQSMGLGLFTFTCLPLQKCHTFTGFPMVTRSVM